MAGRRITGGPATYAGLGVADSARVALTIRVLRLRVECPASIKRRDEKCFCALGARQIQPHRATVRFHRDTKPEERTALPLKIDQARQLTKPLTFRRKRIGVTIVEFFNFYNSAPDFLQ